jgi:hypothetical protein
MSDCVWPPGFTPSLKFGFANTFENRPNFHHAILAVRTHERGRRFHGAHQRHKFVRQGHRGEQPAPTI